MRFITRSQGLATQPRTVIVLKKIDYGTEWGLFEVATDNVIAHGILPERVADSADLIPGIAYCSVAYGSYVSWTGSDELDGKPITETIRAWRGRDSDGETQETGTFADGVLTLSKGRCKYVASSDPRADQRRTRLLCAPIPEAGAETLGVVCVSVDRETALLEEPVVRDRLAKWGLEITPYLAYAHQPPNDVMEDTRAVAVSN